MKREKKNYLLESVIDFFSKLPKGKVLDLGCGDGDYALRLKKMSFEVIAADIDANRFRYKNEVAFRSCDITKTLPFADNSFDYVILMEVVEHLRNPYAVLTEINRVLKKEGSLILSTPNILSLKSRFRYFFEASYEYYREAPLDQAKNPKEKIFNLHINPYRYHEIEYLLFVNGFAVGEVFTSVCEAFYMAIFLPIIIAQARSRERRAIRDGNIDYQRINKKVLSRELLFGRHLIVQAKKISE